MHSGNRPGTLTSSADWWRYAVLLIVATGSLAFVLLKEPIRQDLDYHYFADQRAFLGVPNFLDVASNLLFLFAGVAGVIFCLAEREGRLRTAWLTFFVGVAIVSVGSAYYHLNPNNDTLVWDRLPMTVGFMGMFAALLGEYASARLGKSLLVPAVLLGFFSVLYWHWFDDLRPYFWIQLIPLLTVPVVMILFRSRFTHQWILLVALGLYVFAKISETYDREVFAFTQNLFSGHTLKHLLAALSCFSVLAMLKLRKSTG
jgi:hypothetical protein